MAAPLPYGLGIVPSDAMLLLVQAGCVAAPRALDPRFTERVRRLRGRGWALIPLVSIVGVIFMIRYASSTANWLTYLALVAVPILAFVALAWAARGPTGGGARTVYGRPLLAAVVTGGLFVLAWRDQYELPGQAAGTLLCGLSCVTLGVLLASVTPGGWLKAGVIAMSCADVWLIATSLLQTPNTELVGAAPGAGLPQLQSESFGSMNMGYGDLFVAGVLGGIYAVQAQASALASDRPLQLRAAGLTLAFAAVFDLLFFVPVLLHRTGLPATVPVAAALITIEAVRWRRRTRHRLREVSVAV